MRDGGCTEAGVDLVRVFQLLGKRWNGLVIAVLMEGGGHFAALRRAIPGISERMLSERLSELADAGIVVREVVPGPPLGVRYRLTEAGAALRPALEELSTWSEKYLAESLDSPACREAAAHASESDSC